MRIKDVVSVKGVRDNQLIGYGLVVGLLGTGDTLQNTPFTGQSLQAMMDRMGVNVRNANLRTRNVAAVMVTADLPPFAARGTRMDITVSSMGDATSLMGGTLLLTTLSGADGQTYAVAQGAVSVTGFAAQGQAETLTQGVPTAGHISNGATVEREIVSRMPSDGPMTLELHNPDFNTAVRIADAINAYSWARYRRRAARRAKSQFRRDQPSAECRRHPFHRRDRRSQGRARRAGEGGDRFAHRNGGDRARRPDFAGGGHTGLADSAGDRDAAGVAARALRATRPDRGDAADAGRCE